VARVPIGEGGGGGDLLPGALHVTLAAREPVGERQGIDALLHGPTHGEQPPPVIDTVGRDGLVQQAVRHGLHTRLNAGRDGVAGHQSADGLQPGAIEHQPRVPGPQGSQDALRRWRIVGPDVVIVVRIRHGRPPLRYDGLAGQG